MILTDNLTLESHLTSIFVRRQTNYLVYSLISEPACKSITYRRFSVLKSKVERDVLPDASCVLNPGKYPSYKERFRQLDMLPLAYYGEVKDLVFPFKTVNGYIDININSFFHFVNHGWTRKSLSTKYLETPLCKTCTYSLLYFNRVVKLWNSVCNSIDHSSFHLHHRSEYTSRYCV